MSKKEGKQLVKKSVLSGSLDEESVIQDDPKYLALKEIKTPEEEEITVTNPLTGKTALVTLKRNGTTEENIAAIMLHPDATRDQKDMMIANYLFEQGKESSSFLMELFRSKGQLTKETRSFKTQTRYDFESFVNSFTVSIESAAESVLRNYDITKEKLLSLLEESRKGKKHIGKVLKTHKIGKTTADVAVIEMAIRLKDSVEVMRDGVNRITKLREQQAGKGMYISSTGKIYDLTDKDIADVIREDKKALEEEMAKVDKDN